MEKEMVYKWVNSVDGGYESLMNYGYARLNNSLITKQHIYKINEIQENNDIETNRLKKQSLLHYGMIFNFLKEPGFHFWVDNRKLSDKLRNKMYELGAKNIVTIICEIDKEDIIKKEGNRISAKKFKILIDKEK